MLPPPTTIPTSTPRARTAATWPAISAQTCGSTPYGFAQQRLAGQLQQDPAVAWSGAQHRLPGAVVAHCSSPRAYLVNRRTWMFSPIVATASVTSSRTLRSSSRKGCSRRHDLLNHFLSCPSRIFPGCPPAWTPRTGRGAPRAWRRGRPPGSGRRRRTAGEARDLDGEVPDELLELLRARHEVGLAVDLDEHADAAARVDVAGDQALAGLPVGLLGRGGDAALAQEQDGLVDVPARLLQGALAVHEACARLLAQLA